MAALNLLSLASVARKLDVGNNTVLKMVKRDPSFPRPIRLLDGKDAIAWVEEEVDAWIKHRIQLRKEVEGTTQL